MDNFKYDGKEISFWSIDGTVLDSNKYSETHVSSTGGGGYVGRHGGYVSTPTITSSSLTKHEFWLKTDDGKETEIKWSGIDIPIRVGQQISILCAKEKEEKTGWYTVLVNHNAQKHWHIKTTKELRKEFGIGKSSIFLDFIQASSAGLFLFFIFHIVHDQSKTIKTLLNNPKQEYVFLIIGILTFIIFGYLAIKSTNKTEKEAAYFTKHINLLIEKLYSKNTEKNLA